MDDSQSQYESNSHSEGETPQNTADSMAQLFHDNKDMMIGKAAVAFYTLTTISARVETLTAMVKGLQRTLNSLQSRVKRLVRESTG